MIKYLALISIVIIAIALDNVYGNHSMLDVIAACLLSSIISFIGGYELCFRSKIKSN